MHAGVDLSTTAARCVLLDADLNVLAVGRQPHTSIAEKLQQRADRWVGSVEAAIRDAATIAGTRPDQITSVGVATQGIASVMVDDAGRELAAAEGWLSAGDVPTGTLSIETIDSWYRRSGRRISPVALAGRLLTDPDPADGRWSLAGDLVVHQLTGQWVLDPCLAATTGLLDQCARDWSGSLLDEVGVDRTALSRIEPSGAVAGRARGAMAGRLGLSPDAVVASPTQDQRAAVLIADPAEDSVTVTFGTAVAIVRRADDCTSRLPAQVPMTPGLRPGTWWYEGVVPAAGVTFDWCADLMGISTADWLDLAAEIDVGAAGVVCEPWFGGRGSAGWDPGATGALRGLQLGATRSDVARAVVDAVCAEIACDVEAIGASCDVRIVGRATVHPVIAETLATVLGRPVTRVIVDEPTAHGAALLGAQASGHLASAHDSSLALLRSDVVEPVRSAR